MLLSHTAQREGELLSFLRGELALSSGSNGRMRSFSTARPSSGSSPGRKSPCA